MPINDGSQPVSRKRELMMIAISVDCDGTTNTVRDIRRHNHPVMRDVNGAVLLNGDAEVTIFPFASLPAGMQTALNNFVNNIDTK